MYIDSPYKILDLKPEQELLDFDFSAITLERWDRNQKLKKLFPTIFGELKPLSILFLEANKWDKPEEHDPVFENNDLLIHPLLLKEVKKVEELYDAKAKIAVLDGLAPGARINRHFDQSKIYDICHRVHLPLVTHPDVKFFIDDVPYNFKAGEFFEFNNKMYHEVRNDSDIFRIHLVIDLLPNKR